MTVDAAAPLGLRERGKAERWRRITRAAHEVFREEGYADATLREIAARAEVGTGTIFSYARDKRDLLSKIFDTELEALTEGHIATVPQDAPLLEQLLHLFAPRFDYWAADPPLSRLASQDSYAVPKHERDDKSPMGRFHARRSRLVGYLAELIRRQQARGTVDPLQESELLAWLIMDIYVGTTRRWLASRVPVAADGVAELSRLLAVAIRGMNRPR